MGTIDLYLHLKEYVCVCVQSTICIKQLAYSMLEMVLVSVFPELSDVMLDIHDKARKQS